MVAFTTEQHEELELIKSLVNDVCATSALRREGKYRFDVNLVGIVARFLLTNGAARLPEAVMFYYNNKGWFTDRERATVLLVCEVAEASDLSVGENIALIRTILELGTALHEGMMADQALGYTGDNFDQNLVFELIAYLIDRRFVPYSIDRSIAHVHASGCGGFMNGSSAVVMRVVEYMELFHGDAILEDRAAKLHWVLNPEAIDVAAG